MSRDSQILHISTSTIIRFFLVVLGLALVYVMRDVISALLFAVIIASAFEPGIQWLHKRKIPRILSVILIYLALAAFLALLAYLVFPLFFEEFKNISDSYPALRRKLLIGIDRVGAPSFIDEFKGDIVKTILDLPAKYLENLGGGLVTFASGIFGGALSLFLIVIFSFYLATQEKGIENFLRMVTPLSYEPYIIDLWSRAQRKLGRWFQGQALLGAIVGVFIFFGLTFLGVEHALFFAFLAAIFEIVPVVGPILAAVPAVITALFVSPLTGVLTIALYTIVQQVESNVIVPVVMRKAVGLSPLVVILALVVGGKIGGIFGMILAVPVTAILAEMLEDWDKKKRSLIPGS